MIVRYLGTFYSWVNYFVFSTILLFLVLSGEALAQASLNVDVGANNPVSSNELKETNSLSMLQITFTVPATSTESVKIISLNLTASGTADDSLDISAVRLISDTNKNGLYDTGETVLDGPDTFNSDNGILTLIPDPTETVLTGTSETWLVVYDLYGTAEKGETLAVAIAQPTDIDAQGTPSGTPVTPSGAPLNSNLKTISVPTASPVSGSVPLTVTFNANFGTGSSVTQYEWDFDYDGVAFNPVYTSTLTGTTNFNYAVTGSYTARARFTYFDTNILMRDVVITVTDVSEDNQDIITGSSGSSSSDSQCFIATAAYGTPLTSEVIVLRRFRNNYLLTNPLGQRLVDTYYKLSPPIAEVIRQNESLRGAVRIGLTPLIGLARLMINEKPYGKR